MLYLKICMHTVKMYSRGGHKKKTTQVVEKENQPLLNIDTSILLTDGQTDGELRRPSRSRPPTKRHRQKTVFEDEAAEGLTPRLDGQREFLALTDDVTVGTP